MKDLKSVGESASALVQVLVFAQNGRAVVFDAEGVESSGTRVVINVPAVGPDESSFLEELVRSGSDMVGIAWGSRAVVGRIVSHSTHTTGLSEHWQLELRSFFEGLSSGTIELGHAQYSANQLAELRARRILLDEQVVHGDIEKDLNAAALETLIRGMNSPIKATRSPIPMIFNDLKTDPPRFESIARLFCVFFLLASGAVAVVRKLSIKIASESQVRIEFKGIRHREYENAPPFEITVDGFCEVGEPGSS